MSAADERDLRKGLWKIHVLHHAESREVWGTWLLHELAEHGHPLSPGTLYPALARLERQGWLKRVGKAGHPRSRRGLRLTASGKRLLANLRRDLAELYDEVVLGNEPHHGDDE